MPPTSSWTEQLSQPANLLSAAKWGVITAAGYIVIAYLALLLVVAITPAVGSNSVVLVAPLCLAVFAEAFGVYVAGYLPAAERGNIPTGVAGAIIMIALLAIENAIVTHIQNAHTNSGSVASQIVSLVLLAAIGVGIGWTGAFYGVKRNIKTEASK